MSPYAGRYYGKPGVGMLEQLHWRAGRHWTAAAAGSGGCAGRCAASTGLVRPELCFACVFSCCAWWDASLPALQSLKKPLVGLCSRYIWTLFQSSYAEVPKFVWHLPATWSARQHAGAQSIDSCTCLRHGMPLSMPHTLDMTPCMCSGSFLDQ